MFATPSTEPSIYIEKPLSEVIAGNLIGKEAYKEKYNGNHKYYHIISEAYLQCNNETDWIIYYDNEENSLKVYFSENFGREFNILKNGDYDSRKLYKIKYTLDWAGPGSETADINVFHITIDSIEGMLTYREYENKESERKQAEREAEIESEKLQRKNTVETAYQAALNTAGIEGLIQYIKDFGRDYDRFIYLNDYGDYFNEDAYVEIARRITNNPNIDFHKIKSVQNPYAFEKESVYYCHELYVIQWMDRAFSAAVYRERGDLIYIDEMPNVADIGKIINHAYLVYKGTAETTYANGGKGIIPVFKLIYQF
jgi:hypothetical protein